MSRPELKQFADLTPEDLERHPVWIGCHTADYDEPWYDDTDEETFRPWAGSLPADASEGMLLVRATIELKDGSRHAGFVTPIPDGEPAGTAQPSRRPPRISNPLATQQPQMFVNGRRFGFWSGILRIPGEEREAFYAALGRPPEAVFPLRFSADPALATGNSSGQVDGFYRFSLKDQTVQVDL